jgi:hypothetical protein
MAVLTVDTSTLDIELDELLAHRWTARIIGYGCPLTQRVVTPPPSETDLHWTARRRMNVAALDVLCDGVSVLTIKFPLILTLPGDELTITLQLRSGDE